MIIIFSHTVSGKFGAIEPGLFLSFWSTYHLLILLQHSWGRTFREMCLVAVWQVRPRGAEEEACPEGKGLVFLEFHFVRASVAPALKRVCACSIHWCFWDGKSCRFRCPRLVFEVMGMAGLESGHSRSFPLLGPWEQCSPLCALVSCRHPRVGLGSESSPQAATAHRHSGLPLACTAEITRLRSSFSFLCLRGGLFGKWCRHTHMETIGAGTALVCAVVKVLTFGTTNPVPFIGYVLAYEKKYCFQTNVFTPSRLCCWVNSLCLIPIICSQWFQMHGARCNWSFGWNDYVKQGSSLSCIEAKSRCICWLISQIFSFLKKFI